MGPYAPSAGCFLALTDDSTHFAMAVRRRADPRDAVRPLASPLLPLSAWLPLIGIAGWFAWARARRGMDLLFSSTPLHLRDGVDRVPRDWSLGREHECLLRSGRPLLRDRLGSGRSLLPSSAGFGRSARQADCYT